jgi:hypothetical protein
MIRLIFGLLVVVVFLCWVIISGSQSQISSSKSAIQENSHVFESVQDLLGNLLFSRLHSSDIKSNSSTTGDRHLDIQNAAKPVPNENTDSDYLSPEIQTLSHISKKINGLTAGLNNSSYAASGGGVAGGTFREITIPVPAGAKVPALFHDDTPKPPQQTKALDRIASEFEQNVSEIPAGMTQEEVWDAARLIADERYMTLFGYQAYNQYHIQAAKEALKEKRARSNAKNP